MNINSMFEGREVVCKAMVGSHNYNLNGVNSDVDWKYFVSPTFDDLYKGKMFSKAEQSDTLDYDVHDIRQLGNLLWKSNVNFIEVLFSRDLIFANGLSWIFENREQVAQMNLPLFCSATKGLHFQKMGSLLKGTAKTDILVEKFGYDTKQACHAMRALMTLERFANTHSMAQTLYFENSDTDRQILVDIKTGAYSLEEFKNMVDSWHRNVGPDVLDSYRYFTVNEEIHAEVEDVLYRFIRTMIAR
jgi:uncharacterized protein